ncbi:MAG: ribosome silencing factor [Candidatus Eisenbacteria bacterium]|nr:ribosome silencing factor [Candidatus Eisenbacteria bacterium]
MKGDIIIKEKEKTALTSPKLAREAADLALSKKAEDVAILDLRGLSTVTDFFVICSGSSDTHVKAISDAIESGLEAKGVRKWHIEGYTHKRWVLLDYVDVVVHVFHHKTREFYLLERLWGDAKIEKVVD